METQLQLILVKNKVIRKDERIETRRVSIKIKEIKSFEKECMDWIHEGFEKL